MPPETPPRRDVHCAESLAWLAAQPTLPGTAVVTSLPDVHETSMPLPAWREWFIGAAADILRRIDPDQVAIFYQTDIKQDGAWIDKSYLCQRAAESAGSALLWHRIALRKPPGTPMFGRPGYAHLLAFARDLRERPGDGGVDVFPTGDMLWPRAIGLDACRAACRYVRRRTAAHTILDPFCGRGTVLAVANELGLHAIGVDWSPKRCRQAQALRTDSPPVPEDGD
jgi:hypothetical protein